MAPSDLAQDNKAVDVTGRETHSRIQCQEIKLISSTLRPLDPEKEKLGESRFVFRIRVDAQGNQASGLLETQVIYISSEPGEKLEGFWLRFALIGFFSAEKDLSTEDLADFGRMYTLSILWPYAREYAADQIRRTGETVLTLPVINPQAVTENLIKSDLVEVVIHTEEEKDSEE